MFPAGLFHVLWDASQPCGAFFHFDRCRSARGAARHSKAGVGSATSFDCPARAAAGRRVRVTTRAFIRVEAARFECRAAPPGYRAGRPRPARPYGSQFLSLPPAYEPSTEKVRPVAHPLRLCKPPVGVPSGTDRAGDAKHRDSCRKMFFVRNSAGISPWRPTPPPTDRTAARKPRSPIARPSAAPRGGRNFVAAPPATGPSPKKNLARRSLSARQRNLIQTQNMRLNDFATLGVARGTSYPDHAGTALGPGRPHVPWTGDATHRYNEL